MNGGASMIRARATVATLLLLLLLLPVLATTTDVALTATAAVAAAATAGSIPSTQNAVHSATTEFREQVLLRPLTAPRDGHRQTRTSPASGSRASVNKRPSPTSWLAHFAFQTTEQTKTHLGDAPVPNHVLLLPKPLVLVADRFGVRELSLSLTAGRWRSEHWGGLQDTLGDDAWTAARPESTCPAQQPDGADNNAHCFGDDHLRATKILYSMLKERPVGAEMAVWFDIDLDPQSPTLLKSDSAGSSAREGITDRWNGLRQALSGMFCASLNEMRDSDSSQPRWIFERSVQDSRNVTLKYGALPRENLCTENLTPWTKLLPCRDCAGLARLFGAVQLATAPYHSLQVHLVRGGHGVWSVTQSLTAVVDSRGSVGGSAAGFFRSVLSLDENENAEDGQVVAGATTVDRNMWNVGSLFSLEERSSDSSRCPAAVTSLVMIDLPPWLHSHRYQVSTSKGAVTLPQEGRNVLYFNATDARDVNITMFAATMHDDDAMACGRKEREHGTMYAMTSPLYVSRYLSGHGQFRGELNVVIENRATAPLRITYFEAIPFFLRVFYSSLYFAVDGVALRGPDGDDSTTVWRRGAPPLFFEQFRLVPSELRGAAGELELTFQLGSHSKFEMVVDFHKVFLVWEDFPPDVSRGFDLQAGIVCARPIAPGATLAEEDENDDSLLPCSMRRRTLVHYTEPLLVLLPFPDFSMPFNVIAFVCTVLAFFFGSLFNLAFQEDAELLAKLRSRLWARGADSSPLDAQGQQCSVGLLVQMKAALCRCSHKNKQE